ncbi:MAG: hypothetical protein V4510_04095 [bacterium]
MQRLLAIAAILVLMPSALPSRADILDPVDPLFGNIVPPLHASMPTIRSLVENATCPAGPTPCADSLLPAAIRCIEDVLLHWSEHPGEVNPGDLRPCLLSGLACIQFKESATLDISHVMDRKVTTMSFLTAQEFVWNIPDDPPPRPTGPAVFGGYVLSMSAAPGVNGGC